MRLHSIVLKNIFCRKTKLLVGVLGVDHNQELAAKYAIRVVPTLIMEKDGVEARCFTGVIQGSVLTMASS